MFSEHEVPLGSMGGMAGPHPVGFGSSDWPAGWLEFGYQGHNVSVGVIFPDPENPNDRTYRIVADVDGGDNFIDIDITELLNAQIE